MIYVYAIVDRPSAPLTGTGLAGAALAPQPHGDLVAVTSRHDTRPTVSPEAAIAHATVCDRLLDVSDSVLPVRFGTFYDDEDRLHAALAERHDELTAALTRLRGLVEIGVRVGWDRPETGPPATDKAHPGDARSYLQARVEEERRRRALRADADALAGPLHAELAGRARDAHLRVLATPGLVMSAAYLVERGVVAEFVRHVDRVAAHHPELSILCTGPWPPYHFTPEAAGDGL